MTDLVYLSDLKPGDHVVCMGPNSGIASNRDRDEYVTGRIYPVNQRKAFNEQRTCNLNISIPSDKGPRVWDQFNWRRALGHEVNPPRIKHPLMPDDYPTIIWIRNALPIGNSDYVAFLVLNIKRDGTLVIMDGGGKMAAFAPTKLMETFEYSSDRRTWSPCYREA